MLLWILSSGFPHAFVALLLSPPASALSLLTKSDQKHTSWSRLGIAAAAVPNRIMRFSALILIQFFRQTNLLLGFLPPVTQLVDSSVISLQLQFVRFQGDCDADLQHGAV